MESPGAAPAIEMQPAIKPAAEQIPIVEAVRDDKLIVSAGPGTGKTAVACARVAYLVEHFGVEPTNIWLISFTRTAVKEIRDRICAYIGTRAYGVRIATLDQQAVQLVQGFTAQLAEKLF